jgi:N-acyl-L-homoserine lactone synthetase
MKYSLKELVDKVQVVNNMSLEKVAESIGYTVDRLKEAIETGKEDNAINLLFLKHPNSLTGMNENN